MRSGNFLLVVLATFACLEAGRFVSSVKAFSMIRRYEPDEYSPDQLRDLMDWEYAEELAEPIPVKRQQNQGGTCTCTCETRPVNDDQKPAAAAARPPPAPAQFPEAGSLLRTGTGARPLAASRVLDKTHQTKPGAAGSTGNSDFRSNPGKSESRYSSNMMNMEPSKAENQVVEAKEEEQQQHEEKPAQDEIEQKPTQSPEINSEQSDQHDAWGHSRRFPWKHLPNTMCFRESCNVDKDCCMRYNLCDKSAKVCVDCWYGSICRSEQDCCQRFPYCKRNTKDTRNENIPTGKCVNKV